MKRILIYYFFLLTLPGINAQPLDVSWLRSREIPSAPGQGLYGAKIYLLSATQDPDHNGAISASFSSPISLIAGDTLKPGGSGIVESIFIAGHDENGIFQWANSFKTKKLDNATSAELAVLLERDFEHSVFVGGYFTSSLLEVNATTSVPRACNTPYCTQAYLIKYSNSGSLVWAMPINEVNGNSTKINSITSDLDGNLYIAGLFEGTKIDFGNGVTVDGQGGKGAFLAKITSTGTAIWAKPLIANATSNYNLAPFSIVTRNNKIAMVGFYNGTSLNLGNGVSLAAPNAYGGFIATFNTDGTTLSAVGIDADILDLRKIRMDDAEQIYLLGACYKKIQFVDGTVFHDDPDAEFYTQFVMGFDPTLQFKWLKTFNAGLTGIMDIAMGNQQNTFVCGLIEANSSITVDGLSASTQQNCSLGGYLYDLDNPTGTAQNVYTPGGDACWSPYLMTERGGVNYLYGIFADGNTFSLGDQSVSSTNRARLFLAKIQRGTSATKDIRDISSNIAIAPNPSRGSFHIEYGQGPVSITGLSIYDAAGRLVPSEFSAINGNCTIQSQAPGMYFVKIVLQEGVGIKKIFIE